MPENSILQSNIFSPQSFLLQKMVCAKCGLSIHSSQTFDLSLGQITGQMKNHSGKKAAKREKKGKKVVKTTDITHIVYINLELKPNGLLFLLLLLVVLIVVVV